VGPQLPPRLPISTMYVHICISKMPREKGKEWDHVTIIELKDRMHQQKVECKYCKHVLVASTSRIRKHFLHIDPT